MVQFAPCFSGSGNFMKQYSGLLLGFLTLSLCAQEAYQVQVAKEVNPTLRLPEVKIPWEMLSSLLSEEQDAPLDLSEDPQAVARFLDNAVAHGRLEQIKVLLPHYKKFPEHERNEQLIRFAEAALAQSVGNVKQTIELYREMIANDPNLPPVRLQLALALMRDRQDAAAKDQLERLRSEDLPEEIAAVVDSALAALRERQAWSFGVSGYYVHDSNINQAPDIRSRETDQCPFAEKCTITFPEKENADGLYLRLNADRRLPIKNNWYANFEGSAHANWYWNTDQYDDIQVRLGSGVGYENARFDASVLPFVSQRFYAGKKYAHAAGATVSMNYWMTPKWRLSGIYEGEYAQHDHHSWLDGQRHYQALNLLYLAHSGRYFFGGVNHYYQDAQDDADRFFRYGVNAGWIEDWSGGLSTRLSASVGKRLYQGADLMANIKRNDTEYNTGVQLWYRDWHFWGITPKLSLEWNKTNSNHFYYDRKNGTGRAYIELSKTF